VRTLPIVKQLAGESQRRSRGIQNERVSGSFSGSEERLISTYICSGESGTERQDELASGDCREAASRLSRFSLWRRSQVSPDLQLA